MNIKDLQFQGEQGRDEFQREDIAAKVISLLTSPVDVSPMVIDGSWGVGKTEFCYKLINKFKGEYLDYRLVYIDAFQADHADDPLMTMLAEVLKHVDDESLKVGLIQKAIPALRYGAKTGLKAFVGHVLRQDTGSVVDGFDKEMKQVADKAIDASVEAVLKDHQRAEESLGALKDALKDIAADSPIVMFVDELDRCRPNFAIQVLEVIKHTFDIEGVQFVLVTNSKQLKASINHCYGQDVEAQRYLDKFLKFSFVLPEVLPNRSRDQVLVSTEHFTNLVGASVVLNQNQTFKAEAVLEFIESLIRENALSLREVETFVRHLEIYQTLTPANMGLPDNLFFGYQLLRLFGVFLFCFHAEAALEVVRKRADSAKLCAVLGVERLPNIKESNYYPEHHEVLAVMVGQECHTGSELFTPESAEKNAEWRKLINDYFHGRASHEGDKLADIARVIKVLSLGSPRW